MVDQLLSHGIGLLFCVGGDGTVRGAMAIANEVNRRTLPIGIIGIPKTIDNNLGFIEKSFGFETSLQIASEVITSAHQEAMWAKNGSALTSSWAAIQASLRQQQRWLIQLLSLASFRKLILNSTVRPRGLIEAVKIRLSKNNHAVTVVAEGSDQGLFNNGPEHKNQSRCPKADIGVFLRDEINRRLNAEGISASMKYLGPSYHIHSHLQSHQMRCSAIFL